MKIKTILGRIKTKIHDWRKSEQEDKAATYTPRLPETVSVARERAGERVSELKNYIWVHSGLSNRDRRAMMAQLRKGAVQPVAGRLAGFRVKKQPLTGVARELIKFQLKNSPKNIPAHRDANGKLATNNPIYAAFAAQRGVRVVEGQ